MAKSKGRMIRAWLNPEYEEKWLKIYDFLGYENESATIKRLIDDYWRYFSFRKEIAEKMKEERLKWNIPLKWLE